MAKRFICSMTEPIVLTAGGKIRGFQLDSTYTFHGIKYADARRFQMPTEVAPWDGVKDALSYGHVCPLLRQEIPQGELMAPHRYWPMDEHCQYLNIWTQSLDQHVRKPVMVWLHGGGFSAGSSIEQIAYDGDNMSRYGDVVVVSINHRLNILGYLDLSPFGDQYSNSGNAGNADLVAALRWIQTNIAAFGGDPDNVTIFGQSGGGGKVSALLQTPSADGLFHKAIIQSGVADFGAPPQGNGKMIVKALLDELGLDIGEAGQLETLPYATLAAAYNKVSPALARQGHYIGCAPLPNDFYFGDPLRVGFTEHAGKIPVLVGTVLAEFAFNPLLLRKTSATAEEILASASESFGATVAADLLHLFRTTYPDKNPADVLVVDSLFRKPTRDFIEKRSASRPAPVFSYLFAFDFPCDDGRLAWHCSEIPFVFHNTDKVVVCNLPGISDRLEEQVFGAWISFARHGNPGHPGLPDWPACQPGQESTMIFDRVCQTRLNHDRDLVALHRTVAPNPFGQHVTVH